MKLFTEWLNENNEPLKTSKDVFALIPQSLEAAQKVYDEWEQDEDGHDVELGTGGVCQDIASNIADVLNQHNIESATVSAAIGDQHVYTVAKLADGVFEVDIPPYVYETGGGYNWKKIPNVKFQKDHISIHKLDSDPESFDNYLEY